MSVVRPAQSPNMAPSNPQDAAPAPSPASSSAAAPATDTVFPPLSSLDSAALEIELKNSMREMLQGVETIARHETQLLQAKRELVLRRRHLVACKASYSLADWRDLLLICLLQKRLLVRDQDISSIPSTVPLDPIFRAKTVLLFHVKDYLARKKWRALWTLYKAHPEGQKVLQRLEVVNAIHTEQNLQYQELLQIQNLFLQPLSLMADAGIIPRQDVTNAFHISAIMTLQHVMKAQLDQEKSNWPRSRFARSLATKANLMQQLYSTYTSDTNVMLQSLRRILSKPAVAQYFAEVIAENPSLLADSALAGSSNIESKIQALLERPLSHVSRMLAVLKACLPHLPPDHFLHEDTVQSIEALSQVYAETSRVKQDASHALIAFDATVTSSCSHLFFCNPGTSIKKLGDVDMLVEKSGFFGKSWKPVTLLLCDSLLVVFKPTGKTAGGRPELDYIRHIWLYKHIRCEAAGADQFDKCPITGIKFVLPMDEHQIIVQTSRLLDHFEPLRLRMNDSVGSCKIWMALINKECAKNELVTEVKSTAEKVDDSAENNPTLWKWSGSLDVLTNRLVYAKSSDMEFMSAFIHCVPFITSVDMFLTMLGDRVLKPPPQEWLRANSGPGRSLDVFVRTTHLRIANVGRTWIKMHYEEDFGGGNQAVASALSWFLQQLPEGQRRLIFTERKQGDDESKGHGVINIAMRQLQEKFVFLRNLVVNAGSSGETDMQLSIFSFSNKTLHTELLRIFAKFCATTGVRQFLNMIGHSSISDAVVALQRQVAQKRIKSDCDGLSGWILRTDSICRMFVHELIAAPAQTERLQIASKIIKLLVKSVKELNYALADICCSVLTCTEGVPPPLEFENIESDGCSYQKLLPVPTHMPLTGLTSRAPCMRDLVWSKLTDSQRQVVCDAAEQLHDRGKLLAKSISVRDDSATLAKKVFNSIASQAVTKTPFMCTPPLPYLIKRAHSAAIQEHLTESISTSTSFQMRSRSGGQGLVKRRGSVVSQNDPSFVINGELQLKKVVNIMNIVEPFFEDTSYLSRNFESEHKRTQNVLLATQLQARLVPSWERLDAASRKIFAAQLIIESETLLDKKKKK